MDSDHNLTMEEYFVVLQTLDSKHRPSTMYPEVHYVFQDDEFAPELDVLERQKGDISVIVDLDETGTRIVNCQSISPDWQVLDASLDRQNLDISRRPSANYTSNLLRIRGISPNFQLELQKPPSDVSEQATYCRNLIETIKLRQQELEIAVGNFPESRYQENPI